MNRHNSCTPGHEIKEGDLITLFIGHISATAIVTEAPKIKYCGNNKHICIMMLDYNGIEYRAFWSPDEQMWICREY